MPATLDDTVERVDLSIAPESYSPSDIGDPGDLDGGDASPAESSAPRTGLHGRDMGPTDDGESGDPAKTFAKQLGEWESESDDSEAADAETAPVAATTATPTDQPAEQAADAAATATQETIDPAIRQWAAYLGVERSDFASQAAFERHIIRTAQLVSPADQGTAGAGQPADSKSAEGDKPLDVWEGVDKELIDPEVVKLVDRLTTGLEQKYQGQLSKLESSLAEVQPAVAFYQQSYVQQQERETDAAFAGLNAEFGGLFGDKSVRELADDSAEFRSRVPVLEKALVLAQGYRSAGQEIPDTSTLIREAARIVHTNHLETQAGKKAAEAQRKRGGQAIAQPTSREGRPLSARERGVRAVNQLLRDKGIDLAGDDELNDGI